MPVDRLLPNDEARDLIALVRDIADKRMKPIVDQHEKDRQYPDGLFAELGEAGLLGLPYPTEWDGGGQSYEVYLQVLEELGARWGVGRRRGQCARSRVPSAVQLRYRGTEAALAPGPVERQADRCVQPE